MGIEPMIIGNEDIQKVLDDFVIFDHIQRNKKYAVVVASDGLPIKKPVIWKYVRTNIDNYFVEINNKKRDDDDLSIAYFAPLESSNNNNGNNNSSHYYLPSNLLKNNNNGNNNSSHYYLPSNLLKNNNNGNNNSN
jgi:hypothetical protein